MTIYVVAFQPHFLIPAQLLHLILYHTSYVTQVYLGGVSLYTINLQVMETAALWCQYDSLLLIATTLLQPVVD